jgi:hypothetical protein
MIHKFEIQKPIWKSRSVGVNLINAQPNDELEIEIAYENKAGKRIYPHVYSISASEAHKYPTQKFGSVVVHVIPIADLKIKVTGSTVKEIFSSAIASSEQTTNQQKQATMLFDNKEIDKIRKENAERSGNDTRKTIETGEALVTQSNSRIEKSKTDNAPMLIVDFVKSPDYRPITVYWKLAGSGSEIHKGKIVSHLESAFGYIIQPCKDENDLLTQVKKFDGKSLKIAVQHKDSLWDNKKGETVIVTKAEYWYSGASNDNNFKVDPAKIKVGLDEKQMKRFNDITELNGVAPRKAGEKSEVTPAVNNAAATPVVKPVLENKPPEDDLPF